MLAGAFLPEIYYRLSAVSFALPPLRDRKEDIPALVQMFIDTVSREQQRPLQGLGPGSLPILLRHLWPGNVRELESVIRAACLSSEAQWLRPIDLVILPLEPAGSKEGESALPENFTLDGVIRRHILQVLKLCDGNKARAASKLGISRSTLYRMLEADLAMPMQSADVSKRKWWHRPLSLTTTEFPGWHAAVDCLALFACAKCRYTAHRPEFLRRAPIDRCVWVAPSFHDVRKPHRNPGSSFQRVQESFCHPYPSVILFVFLALTTSGGTAQDLPLNNRVKTLNAIFTDYWEDQLKHEPEFASSIGDNRYNDQLRDYSVQAYNESLSRQRGFLSRLAEVDTAGMPAQAQLSKDLLVRELILNQQEARFKPWEMPVTQMDGLQISLPQLVPQLTFNSVKDYDDYIARLKKVPLAFQQITDDMSIGMDDHREPPAYLMEKVLVQVNAIANQKPEDGPFAQPLKKFPASVSATQQDAHQARAVGGDRLGKWRLPTFVSASFLRRNTFPAAVTIPASGLSRTVMPITVFG